MTDKTIPAGVIDPEVETRISKDEINALPLNRYEGPIRVVRDGDSLKEALEKLADVPVIGFDTESRPSFKKGVSYPPAVVQVATAEEVFIFQLRHLTGGVKGLCPFFTDGRTRKVGVALHEDLRRLQSLARFKPAGFFELGEVTRNLGIVNTGLRSLAGIFLGFRVSKNAQVSNWNKSELTETQLRYAATDAWVCLEIYKRFRGMGLLDEAS